MIVGELAKKGFSKLIEELSQWSSRPIRNMFEDAAGTAGRSVDDATRKAKNVSGISSPGTTGSENIVKGSTDSMAAAAKKPWYKKKKTYAIPALLGAGVWGGYNWLPGDDTPPAGVRDYSQFTPRDTGLTALEQMLKDQQSRTMSALRSDRDKALSGYGNTERAALGRLISERNSWMQGQSGALRDEFGRVGGLYGDNVTSAQQAGAEGARGIRKAYGNAAAQTRKAAQSKSGPAGQSRTGALTPVSGPLASMPADMQATGASLAKYLGDQAAIAAKDAGYDAATAVEYGNAVANDMVARAYFDGLEKEYALETELGRNQAAMAAEYDRMMRQTEFDFMDREFELEKEKLVQGAQANLRPENLTPREWQKVDAEWETIASNDQEELNWQAVGVYDSTGFAQWLAEQGILGEVVYGQPE
jgi:hypothetical protein